MEKLGKLVYENDDLTYKYKGTVDIPSLGMVDDVLAVQKCVNEAVKINAFFNAFFETKKLKLTKKKCHQIHVSKKSNNENVCTKLKIHDDEMKESSKQSIWVI